MSPATLRQGLDRDVYAVLKKLEGADEGSLRTVGQVYDAIQSSNSHLRRQKKRPLEDSIDRVLQFRREELEDLDDSDAAIEEEEARQLPKKTEDERFLLNRQMTKHWHANQTPASSAKSSSDERQAKRRRIQDEEKDDRGRGSGGEGQPTPPRTNGTRKESGVDREKPSEGPKKAPKPNRFHVEHPPRGRRLGGVKDVEEQLYKLVRTVLRQGAILERHRWVKNTGVLLSGPVGVGKRSLVRTVASRLRVPIVAISPCLDDTERMEKSVIEAMDEAMRLAPSIIFIEEVHRHMARPGGTDHSEHHERVVRFFERQRIRMMDELSPDAHVLVVGTTSNVANVHPDVLYGGCFMQTIQVRLPDPAGREDILRVLSEDTDVSDDVDFAEVAKMTHGFVGMDLSRILTLAQQVSSIREGDALLLASGGVMDTEDESHEDEWATVGARSDNTLTLDDIRFVLKDYVPSLRQEGFTVIPDVSWDQVGALEKVHKQLYMSIIGRIKTPDLFKSFGLTRPSGVILWGPPGCGKTLVAQAVANEAQASFILINGPELLNKYVGESERAVRELFQRARSSTPCILFFDEMDSLVPRREGASSEAGVRVVNALLTELDGVRDRSGIYVIGTTNRPDMIDAAMLRPGRLSIRIFVDLPTEDERVEILRTIFRNFKPDASDAELSSLETVARDARCRDFSGADLGGLHTKAAETAMQKWLSGEKSTREIDMEDWEQALATTTRSVTNPGWYRELEERIGAS